MFRRDPPHPPKRPWQKLHRRGEWNPSTLCLRKEGTWHEADDLDIDQPENSHESDLPPQSGPKRRLFWKWGGGIKVVKDERGKGLPVDLQEAGSLGLNKNTLGPPKPVAHRAQERRKAGGGLWKKPLIAAFFGEGKRVHPSGNLTGNRSPFPGTSVCFYQKQKRGTSRVHKGQSRPLTLCGESFWGPLTFTPDKKFTNSGWVEKEVEVN